MLLPFAAVSEDQALTTTNRPPPFARGTINKLDQYHKTLSILPRSGDAEEDFLWTARTVIYLGPERLTADKLRPGDEIAIRHQTDADGKRLIVRMKVYREGIPRTALDKTEP